MTTKARRDLAADLALCEAATPGPWTVKYNDFLYDATGDMIAELLGDGVNDSFIAEAREGWPHAIRRALETEAEVERIRNYVEKRLARAEKRVNEIAADQGEKPEQTHNYFGGRSLGYWQGRASALDDVLSTLPEVPDDAAQTSE